MSADLLVDRGPVVPRNSKQAILDVRLQLVAWSSAIQVARVVSPGPDRVFEPDLRLPFGAQRMCRRHLTTLEGAPRSAQTRSHRIAAA